METPTMKPLPRRPRRLLRRLPAAAAGCVLAAFAVGCVPVNYGPAYYGGYQTRMAQTVQFGVVEAARPVVIADRYNSGVGALTGAAIGGIAGSAIGQGRGAALAAIGGALIGGLAGNAIENQSSAQTGLEVTVRLDSGRIVAITQGAGEPFYRGDRVHVLSAPDGSARVTH